jgi:oligopeptide/dipeptide ABC transporter ATP-binding protein
MTDPDIILETKGLRREFVTARPLFGAPTVVRAVDGVDLQIRRGETFAIVGESGCGKSTLARMLVRLIEPTDGAVFYQGRDIGHGTPAETRALRRDLQFIFQDPFSSLNPRMTVGALIEEPLRTHGLGTPAERRAKVAALLTRVGLTPQHANRYPHEFSGGQRQRIGIARALASGPKLVVGDEPVSALDVSIQAQVVNILQDLKDDFGLTLVIIAHDLAVIRHMADRVAVMYLGELVELASAQDLFDAPKHPYAEALAAAIPLPQIGARKVQAGIAGDPPNPINPPSGCRFHPRCPYAIARCASERPALAAISGGRSVACHRAAELTLTGLAGVETRRSPAVQKRFDLYRQARAAQDAPPPAVQSKRSTTNAT